MNMGNLDYLRSMTFQLGRMAKAGDYGTLAFILGMAHMEADQLVLAEEAAQKDKTERLEEATTSGTKARRNTRVG